MQAYRRFSREQSKELAPLFKELVAIVVLLANQRLGLALRAIPCAPVRGGMVVNRKTILVTRRHLVNRDARSPRQWSPEEETLQQVLDMLVETLTPGRTILGMRLGRPMREQLYDVLLSQTSQDTGATFRMVEEFAKQAEPICLPQLLEG